MAAIKAEETLECPSGNPSQRLHIAEAVSKRALVLFGGGSRPTGTLCIGFVALREG
jgi:hypothetical protein